MTVQKTVAGYVYQSRVGMTPEAHSIIEKYDPHGAPQVAVFSAFLMDMKQPKGFFGGTEVAGIIIASPTSSEIGRSDIQLYEARISHCPEAQISAPTLADFLNLVKQDFYVYDDGTDALLSYSDLQFGETGDIEREAGWNYFGYRPRSGDSIMFVWPSGNIKIYPRRTCNDKFGTSGVERLNREKLGPCAFGAVAIRHKDYGKLLNGVALSDKGGKFLKSLDLVRSKFRLQNWSVVDVLNYIQKNKDKWDAEESNSLKGTVEND